MKRPGTTTPTAELNEVMKDFRITIETWHKPDLGNEENVHKLDEDKWKNVTVVPIDIANRGQVSDRDYKPEEDPTLFKSTKTGRGPLGPNWKEELAANPDWPRMCAYKLVTADFKWFGMRDSMEHFAQEQEMRLFTNFHRQLFCSIDKWVDLTMDDIRRIEDQTTKDLDELRKTENLRGRTAE
ncbi:phosphatidylinositol transfer protein alpha isoform-like [Antennarius striatus]|uniref:phosphatidylinositol transfer protein alpha isoform-like n=1 Tax=Antennarius striatus TaxID=241820 RepID=UPI0035B46160